MSLPEINLNHEVTPTVNFIKTGFDTSPIIPVIVPSK